MARLKRVLAGATLACALPFSSAPETTLAGAELLESCLAYRAEPRSAAGLFCAAYVQGFIDAAAAIDPRVRTHPAGNQESWIERARRTRLGERHTQKPAYCIDASVTVGQVIVEVLAHADTHPASGEIPAADLVTQVLQRFHPC